MSAAQDITGQRFGRLVALKCVGTSVHKRRIWLCQCDCGNTTEVLANSLKTGRTVSCKCYTKELASKHSKKHGCRNSTEYESWLGMKNRCYNTKQKQYKDYGGRGIIVCDRWLHSFENFLEDMGKKPARKHSIERVDYNGNYEPCNCIWADAKTQGLNKRNNKYIAYNGERLHISEWVKRLDIHPSTLYKHKNLTPDEALAKIHDKHIFPRGINKQ